MNLKSMRIGQRLGVSFAMILTLMVGIGLYGKFTMDNLAELPDKLYKHPFTVSTSMLKVNSITYNMDLQLQEAVLYGSADMIEQARTNMEALEAEAMEQFSYVDKAFLGDKAPLKEARELLASWGAVWNNMLDMSLHGQSNQKITAYDDAINNPHFEKMVQANDYVINLAFKKADEFMNSAHDTRHEAVLSTYALLAAGVLIALCLGVMVTRGIVRPIGQAVSVADRISDGHFDNKITNERKDEAGQLLSALEKMQTVLFAKIIQEKEAASRINTALDSVTSNVMMADESYNIIYINSALKAMFSANKKALQEALPKFDVDNLIGQSIDIFHKDPSHQRRILDSLTTTYTTPDLELGGVWLRITVNPVFDEQGNRVGTVTEWEDRAEARQAEAVAAEAFRVTTALDRVSAGVMMADEENNIIFMNDAVEAMFKKNEASIRKDLPNFNADNLIGTNMDVFDRNPSHQQGMVKALQSTHVANITVGGLSLRFNANPVFNDDGERLGTVIEWLDRTDEVRLEEQVEREVKAVVEAAQRGELSGRVNVDNLDGLIGGLSESLNDLLDVTERAVKDTIEGLQALERGDLTFRISNNYEGVFDDIKQASNNTAEKLANVIGNVNDAAEEVSVGSGEIETGNNALSNRTQEQASALEETAASIEEITGTVQQTADNSRQANQLANDAKVQAEKGGEVADKAVQAMSEINTSSRKIAEIIGVIDEIAFQTNLLALNAAVEAARAGDQGRGFAVVAGEVRSLAQRSAEAAKEIKGLINQSVESVELGSKLVDESGQALADIVAAVGKVNEIIAEIAAASTEQTGGIEQINQAVAQLDAGTQQNTALVEEAAAASKRLNEQAVNLKELVSVFDLGVQQSPSRQASRSDAQVDNIVKAQIKNISSTKRTSKRNNSTKDNVWEEF